MMIETLMQVREPHAREMCHLGEESLHSLTLKLFQISATYAM